MTTCKMSWKEPSVLPCVYGDGTWAGTGNGDVPTPSVTGVGNGGDGGMAGSEGDSTVGSVARAPLDAAAYERGRGEPAGGAGSGKDM